MIVDVAEDVLPALPNQHRWPLFSAATAGAASSRPATTEPMRMSGRTRPRTRAEVEPCRRCS